MKERKLSELDVLFVDHSALPGGGQLGLARYLRQSRLPSLRLVALGPGPAFDIAKEAGRPVQIIGKSNGRHAYLRTRNTLARVIKKTRPTLVVANGLKAALVLGYTHLPRGTKRVFYLRDDLNPRRNSTLKRWVTKNLILPRYHALLTNSFWTASTIPHRFRKKPRRVAYPVCGIRLEPPKQMSTPLHVLSLSRLAPWKGVHVLLDALSILEARGFQDALKVTIAGDTFHAEPEYAKRLERTAHKLEIPVTFVGHLSNPWDTLTSSDCLVAASITPEPFGQVITQGMAASKIVIAGKEGGALEQITTGRDGILVEPNNSRQLADAIESIIQKRFDVTAMQCAAGESARRFSDDTTVASLDEALASLAAELEPLKARSKR